MLTHIHIRDFAIVNQLELELGPGMTAMTGETGAGKSILVDALGFALGDRTDAGFVRNGTEKTTINASFSLNDAPDARAWLSDQELDADESEVHLRRIITAEGRSRSFINGNPCPLQSLKQLGEYLLDIHGQHEHQSLLKKEAQTQLLDHYAEHDARLNKLGKMFKDWQQAHHELSTLKAAAADRDNRLDLLRYQVQELDTLELSEEEWPELNQEHAQLANAGRLMQSSGLALNNLYDGDTSTAHHLLSHALAELEPLAEIDSQLRPVTEMLNDALIQTSEAADELRRYSDNLDQDPQRLMFVENRIGAVTELARKHRIEPQQLPARHLELLEELKELDQSGETLIALQEELDALETHYLKAAHDLSTSRRKFAKTLSNKVSKAMHQLGMANGRFEIQVESDESARYTANGRDKIEFLVTANAGQNLRPLAKVASGGELSRISLAIQVITARNGGVPTMIFDEVDSGIGGAIAEVVGKELRSLGKTRQVLCVTHLPQVAAQAHAHLQVAKSTNKGMTQSGIKHLQEADRITEVARMLGGIELTSQTLAHASEMIENAQLH